VDARRRRLSLSLRPKREDREDRPPRRDRDDRPPRRDRDDRSRGDRVSESGGGLRTGAFDALADLDLEER